MSRVEILDRLPPFSEKMEKAVLGSILIKPSEVLPGCESRFKCGAEVFYDLRNQTIYNYILALHAANSPISLITLQESLRKSSNLEQVGGIAYLMTLEDAVASYHDFEYYADQVAEHYMQRQTLAACIEAAGQVYENQQAADEVISGIELKLQSIRELRSNETVVEGKKSANLLMNHLERRYELKGAKSGIVTKLHALDRMTDGLQYGEQTIIGARPSQGKTALATTIIYNACLIDKVPTLVVTLEMSIDALCRRMLANHSKTSMGVLRAGSFSAEDFGKFSAFGALISKAPIFFMDGISGADSARICGAIERLAKNSGVKLVVIDYLQKIKASGNHEKRTYEVAQVSGALKAAAVRSGCALLTLAQLNREPEQQKGRKPRLSDLADSSQIERDGDTIILLDRCRDSGHEHEAKLHIAKQRDGETGTIDVHFEGQYCAFENVSYPNVS